MSEQRLTFYLRANVTVVSGVGSVIFWDEADAPPSGFVAGLSARLLNVAIKAPTGAAVFSWFIQDADGFAVAGREGLIGNVTTIELAPIYPKATMHIVDASVDGTFQFKIYAEQAH